MRSIHPGSCKLEAWSPHNIIGNVHYVGTRNLSAFLISTAGGAHPDQQHFRRDPAYGAAID